MVLSVGVWVGEAGTAVHNTPVLGQLKDSTWAIAHGRGGGHGPLEKPYGPSLTRLEDGSTIWSTDLGKGTESSFQSHWNADEVYWFQGHEHLALDATTGEILRRANMRDSVRITWTDGRTPSTGRADIALKRMPCTNQTNIIVGDRHYFLAHDIAALGAVSLGDGEPEYLQLPVQKIAGSSASDDQLVWEKEDAIPNDTRNSRGIDIAPDKRAKGTGFGHVSAASPIAINGLLYIPVMNGTVFVIDTKRERFDEGSLVAVNDLGPAGETWNLSQFTYAHGRLYAHTMKEVICIGHPPL